MSMQFLQDIFTTTDQQNMAIWKLITTSASEKPLAKAPSGIRIVKVYTDRIESSYYGLDEIPEIIF
jgi:hypothetical protein